MKLPFDENLSIRLPQVLADFFPESLHVQDVGLEASEDEAIRRYAVENRQLRQAGPTAWAGAAHPVSAFDLLRARLRTRRRT